MRHPTERRFALYGFGVTGKYIVDYLLEHGFHLDLIIDKDKHGATYHNVKIISLEEISDYPLLSELTCIVGLHNPYVDLHALHADLAGIGFKEVMSLIQLAKIIPSIKLPHSFWFDSQFDYDHYAPQFSSLIDLLEDQKSKQLVKNILQYRKEGQLDGCPYPSLFDQYTPTDLPKYSNPLRLIDCGACTGDAIEKFIQAGYTIDCVAAFEPDPNNYAKLCEKNFAANLLFMLPVGAWSSNTQVRFDSLSSTSSRVSESGQSIIQCMKIDDAVKKFKPNLIKFDIEGAEIEALRGLQQTITASKPNLCVSIYHTPTHLFEILLLIKSWALHYRFYIRVHAFNTFDVVLYCLNDALIA